MATDWDSVNNMGDILKAANTNTSGYFWLAMLFMIYVVLIISMLGFGIETAFLASSFAMLIVGIIFVALGLISWSYIAIFVGVILILILWINYTRPKQ